MVRTGGRSLRAAAVALAAAVVLAGCSVKFTGANTVEEFSEEEEYLAVYQKGFSRLLVDQQGYAPIAQSPGVCNKGGSAQDCYDLDQVVIEDLRSIKTAFSQIAIPPRLREAHAPLMQAVDRHIEALKVRSAAVASGDAYASFAPSNEKLQGALDLYVEAYAAFPADNKPQPALTA